MRRFSETVVIGHSKISWQLAWPKATNMPLETALLTRTEGGHVRYLQAYCRSWRRASSVWMSSINLQFSVFTGQGCWYYLVLVALVPSVPSDWVDSIPWVTNCIGPKGSWRSNPEPFGCEHVEDWYTRDKPFVRQPLISNCLLELCQRAWQGQLFQIEGLSRSKWAVSDTNQQRHRVVLRLQRINAGAADFTRAHDLSPDFGQSGLVKCSARTNRRLAYF